jgi:GT2 family glycosyltransferase
MALQDLVSVTIVTYNSGGFIKRCLDAVLAQKYRDIEVVVVDNASTDGTIDILEQFGEKIRILYNDENLGFAAAQNQAIAHSRGEWVLTLNPDVFMMPGFIAQLVEAGQLHPRIGSVCGKLLTISASFDLPEKARLDSTGMYITPMLRHLDRGCQQDDNGEYNNLEYVFGATAAAALYRREMIEDIAIFGEFFDNDFFCYREDADVAWRAQLFGWRCLYTPGPKAYHVRKVTPMNRRALPPEINMHSVKNRFLLRIKNMTADLYKRHWMAVSFRDVVVLGGCLLREHSSLRAFWELGRLRKRAFQKRAEIMKRRRVTDEEMASWFQPKPVALRVNKPSQRVAARVKPARG